VSADDLYETDFVAWTERQAAALRALSPGANALDPTRVAEEIADLGRAERRACESYAAHILDHLITLASGASQPAQGWRVEIAAARRRLAKRAPPSIRAGFEMDSVWADARATAAVALSEYGDRAPRLASSCPLSFDALIDADVAIEALVAAISDSIAGEEERPAGWWTIRRSSPARRPASARRPRRSSPAQAPPSRSSL